jgi:hypothetical protein
MFLELIGVSSTILFGLLLLTWLGNIFVLGMAFAWISTIALLLSAVWFMRQCTGVDFTDKVNQNLGEVAVF